MKYQDNYSLHFPATKDRATRLRKATKIIQALDNHLGSDDFHGLKCLDLGCSVGVISRTLAAAGAFVVGIDIDKAALHLATSEHTGSAIYLQGDVGATPLPDETFDVLVCSQVYEHSPSLSLLVGEIQRLLKPGGICFFGGPNRWAVMENHYHLPFLSWLPVEWANRYLRWSGRASEYYEHPRTAGELRQAFSGFLIQDLTPEILRHPERYAMGPEVGAFKYVARLVPEWLLRRLGCAVPNFNWILVKVNS